MTIPDKVSSRLPIPPPPTISHDLPQTWTVEPRFRKTANKRILSSISGILPFGLLPLALLRIISHMMTLLTPAVPQIPAREPSMNRPRKKCNALFKEYLYRPTSIQTRSHRPRMRTSLLVLLAHL